MKHNHERCIWQENPSFLTIVARACEIHLDNLEEYVEEDSEMPLRDWLCVDWKVVCDQLRQELIGEQDREIQKSGLISFPHPRTGTQSCTHCLYFCTCSCIMLYHKWTKIVFWSVILHSEHILTYHHTKAFLTLCTLEWAQCCWISVRFVVILTEGCEASTANAVVYLVSWSFAAAPERGRYTSLYTIPVWSRNSLAPAKHRLELVIFTDGLRKNIFTQSFHYKRGWLNNQAQQI